MTAGFLWRRGGSIRLMASRARSTADPPEKPRSVPNRMESPEPPKRLRWERAEKIAAATASAMGAAFPMWQIR